jgi:hypothetical protein
VLWYYSLPYYHTPFISFLQFLRDFIIFFWSFLVPYPVVYFCHLPLFPKHPLNCVMSVFLFSSSIYLWEKECSAWISEARLFYFTSSSFLCPFLYKWHNFVLLCDSIISHSVVHFSFPFVCWWKFYTLAHSPSIIF